MSHSVADNPSDSPQLQRMGAAATGELRSVVRGALNVLFGAFLKNLRAALVQASQGVGTPADQAAALQMARKLENIAGGWLNAFLKHVDDQLVGGLAGSRADSGHGGGEEVALAAMELRAEARYQLPITELDARLNRIRLMVYVQIYTRALAPAGLFRSLHDTAEAQAWPAGQRQFLFRQFDEFVIPKLDVLYRQLLDALKALDAAAVKAAAEKAAAEKAAAEKAAAEALAAPAAADEPAPAVVMVTEASPVRLPVEPPVGSGKVDSTTLSMLKDCALNTDGEGYTDGLLAADLLALAEQRPPPDMTVEQSQAPLQRMELAGKFLNDVIADPMMPEEMKPQQEAMRMPLIKSALADPTLFTDVTHPLRKLVNEFMFKSAFSRVSNTPESRRMVNMLQEVLTTFNLAPDFVRKAMTTAQPIEKGHIARFFEQQRQHAEEGRKAVISEAKRKVSRELERFSFGINVPDSAVKFLDKSWGPMATKQLLQYGAADEHWKGTLTLMEQIMEELENREPEEPPTPEWKELMRRAGRNMMEEGMSVDEITEALSSLEAARITPV